MDPSGTEHGSARNANISVSSVSIAPATSPCDSTVSEIINILQLRASGKALPEKYQAKRLDFPLSTTAYDKLRDQITADSRVADFFDDKQKYNYSADLNLFTLRMPSTVHDFFTGRMNDEITSQIKGWHSVIKDHIYQGLGANIHFKSLQASTKHPEMGCPDGQFRMRNRAFPGVVIETASSETELELRRSAEKYLVRSKGAIKVVIGIALPYGRRTSGTVWVWRLAKVQLGISADSSPKTYMECGSDITIVFREGDNRHLRAGSLILKPEDFGTRIPSEHIDSRDEIKISAAQLNNMLDISYELEASDNIREVSEYDDNVSFVEH